MENKSTITDRMNSPMFPMPENTQKPNQKSKLKTKPKHPAKPNSK